MSKKGAFGLVCVGLVLLTCFAAEAKDESGSKTVVVKCDKGDSINEALEEKADILIIEVQGWCTEDVVIERDFVTLRGSNPLVDGIEAARPEPHLSAAVYIRGAREVVLESLGISSGGGESALWVVHSDGGEVVDCHLEGGDSWVVRVRGSTFNFLEGTEITNNLNGLKANGLRANQGSRVYCNSCVIEVPNGWGFRAESDSSIDLESSTVNGALRTDVGGVLGVGNSDVTAPEGRAIRSAGTLEWDGGTLDGGITIEGGGWALIEGVTQTSVPSEHHEVEHNSTLLLYDSTLLGLVRRSSISHWIFQLQPMLQGGATGV
jgi:hypothetical protein